MKQVSLVTGGARSGKSSHAMMLARALSPRGLYFVATAEALDDEMTARIAHHRAARPADIVTLEVPRDLCGALTAMPDDAAMVVVDCLTLWISNLMGAGMPDDAILAEARRLAAMLTAARYSSIVVTDEVGAGIVPDNPVARRFRDLLGWTNQVIAAAADEVILMVAGVPMRVK